MVESNIQLNEEAKSKEVMLEEMRGDAEEAAAIGARASSDERAGPKPKDSRHHAEDSLFEHLVQFRTPQRSTCHGSTVLLILYAIFSSFLLNPKMTKENTKKIEKALGKTGRLICAVARVRHGCFFRVLRGGRWIGRRTQCRHPLGPERGFCSSLYNHILTLLTSCSLQPMVMSIPTW
jgi:hypothetical protein